MINLFAIFAFEDGKQLLSRLYVEIFVVLCGKMPQGCGGCGSTRIMLIRSTASSQMPCNKVSIFTNGYILIIPVCKKTVESLGLSY